MDSLPYELLKMIVDEVPDRKDLRRIRTVNKTFCALATPRVFQRYSVDGTAENATAINEIARRETLAKCIKHIKFSPQLFYSPGSELYYTVLASRGRLNVIRQARSKERLSAWLEDITTAFSSLHNLAALKSLILSFFPPYLTLGDVSDEMSRLQRTVLSTILQQPSLPPLTTLSLFGLAPFHDPMFDLPSFQNLFLSLAHLDITFHHEGLWRPCLRDSFIEFWQNVVQLRIFGTLASHPQSLTELCLHSNIDVGIVARIDFSGLHFPALRFVSLGCKMHVLKASLYVSGKYKVIDKS